MRQLISLIIPMYNESANILPLFARLHEVLDSINYEWEVICINDGSKDDTLIQLQLLHQQNQRIKIIDFSRNFGKEAAMTAGINFAQGAAVIPFDADLQHPAELIPTLIEKWQQGFDIVNAVRKERNEEHWLKRITSRLFYRVINKLSSVTIPADIGDFRLLSRRVVDAVKLLPERRRFMKGLFSWVGFHSTEVEFECQPRHAGKSHFNYWRLWNFALEGITSFSQVPLQIASYIGFFVAFFSLIYGLYLIISTLFSGNPVAGYPSLMVAILFFGGVQLIALGILGEYLGRVYDETKQRPVYIVREYWGSTSE